MLVPMPELRPLSLGEILDLAIKLFVRNAKVLLKIVLLVVVPIQVITVLITLSTIPDAFGTPGTFTPPDPTQPVVLPSDFWTFLAGQLLLVVVLWGGVIFASGACFKAIADAYLGIAPNSKTSMRFALSHLGSLFWLTFLTGILLVIAALALVIPAIYLWCAWAVAVPVLLVESKRGMSALNRSQALVKGRWWPTFGTLFVGTLLAGFVGQVIPVLLQFVVISNTGDNIVASTILTGFGGVVSGVITTPFQAALVAIIYFDLRIRKEGFDLQLLAQRIGSPLPEYTQPAPTPWVQPGYGPAPWTSPGSGPWDAPAPAQPPYWPPPPGWAPPPQSFPPPPQQPPPPPPPPPPQR